MQDNGSQSHVPLRTLAGAAFDRAKADAAVAGILELQKRHTLGGLSLEDRVNEGREA